MADHPRLIADKPDTETLVAVLIALGEQLDLARFLYALGIQRRKYKESTLPCASEVAANLKAIDDVLVRLAAVREKPGGPGH